MIAHDATIAARMMAALRSVVKNIVAKIIYNGDSKQKQRCHVHHRKKRRAYDKKNDKYHNPIDRKPNTDVGAVCDVAKRERNFVERECPRLQNATDDGQKNIHHKIIVNDFGLKSQGLVSGIMLHD